MSHKDDYRPSHLAADENNEMPPEPAKTKNKKEKKRRRIHPAITIIAVILVILIGGSYLPFNYFYSRLNISHVGEIIHSLRGDKTETIDGEEFPSAEGWDYDIADVTNILLIGVDNDNLEGLDAQENADGLMILSLSLIHI